MTVSDPTVLLVDDDPLLRGFLADNLIADGFAVVSAESLADALRRIELSPPDVVVVDVALPDGSGLDLVARVRGSAQAGTRVDPGLPMLVLSGLGGELDRVRGFDRGADDYVVKPFSYPELRRRIEALLRRAGERVGSGLVRVRDLEIDPVGREVRVAGERAAVSRRSSRCCSRWPPSRRACSPRRSSFATSGATGRWGARARWTRTRAACGPSSAAGSS